MKVVRFDFKQTRSHRLASDKFAFVCSVWHSLETVCKTANLGLTLQLTNNCFHPRQDANLHNICLTNPINLALSFVLMWNQSRLYAKRFSLFRQRWIKTGRFDPRWACCSVFASTLHKIRKKRYDKQLFTSLHLAKLLKQQDISIVGIMNRIRKEIPKEIKMIKEDLHSTKVFKHDYCTLTVDPGKKNKNLLLLSTMHPAVKIGDDNKLLPKTVAFCDATK